MYRQYKDYQTAFLGNLKMLLYGNSAVGVNRVVVKDVETKEMLHRNFTILEPQKRVMVVPHRNDNIFAKIAETMWVLAGRDDMDFLAHYLPRAPQWADDGKHWRAAYGPRLRQWRQETRTWLDSQNYSHTSVDAGTDQISKCVQLLQKDPQSRQAVITLWDPAADWVESLDIPCNNWLHFIIRDNKLHMAVAVRSNDILWGFSGINFFEWSVLHEAMAHWLSVEVGHINWFASSLHLYERHYNRAEKILSETDSMSDSLYDFGIPHVAWDTEFYALDTVLAEFFAYEAQIRDNYRLGWPGQVIEGQNSFIHTCLTMLTAYNAYQQKAIGADVASILNTLPMSDFRIAAIEYMMRQFGQDFLLDMSLSVGERQFFNWYTS